VYVWGEGEEWKMRVNIGGGVGGAVAYCSILIHTLSSASPPSPSFVYHLPSSLSYVIIKPTTAVFIIVTVSDRHLLG
jgi:hypothetical protein